MRFATVQARVRSVRDEDKELASERLAKGARLYEQVNVLLLDSRQRLVVF